MTNIILVFLLSIAAWCGALGLIEPSGYDFGNVPLWVWLIFFTGFILWVKNK